MERSPDRERLTPHRSGVDVSPPWERVDVSPCVVAGFLFGLEALVASLPLVTLPFTFLKVLSFSLLFLFLYFFFFFANCKTPDLLCTIWTSFDPHKRSHHSEQEKTT